MFIRNISSSHRLCIDKTKVTGSTAKKGVIVLVLQNCMLIRGHLLNIFEDNLR